MDSRDIERIYNQEGRNAALAAYPAAIGENKGNEEKMNALAFTAADYSDAKALKLLFDAGVPPSVTDKYAFTLLHYAARRPESGRVRHAHPPGAAKETTLLLLDNNVSGLRKDENENMTCYHYAAQNGVAEMVEALVSRNVKITMTDRDGNTGAHIAAEYAGHAVKDAEIKKTALERDEKERAAAEAKQKEFGRSASEIEDYLRSRNEKIGRTRKDIESASALLENYFRTVKAFADGGLDISEKNSVGKTALDIAVESNAKKIAAFLSGSPTDGASVSAGGMTLHQAAEKGDVAAIKALADGGADLNGLKDDKRELNGMTPLGVACMFYRADAVEVLLSYGADPSFKDANGKAAACYLTAGSANPDVYEKRYIQKIVKDLVSAGMDINMRVNDGSDTLLTLAFISSSGHSYKKRSTAGDVIDEVMKHKPDINATNNLGETALMYACIRDFAMMENLQLTLLEQGATVSAADKKGNTALHYAASNDDANGAKVLCDMLLEFSADANAVNNAKKTALDIATERNNEPLVKLLLGKM